MHDSNSDSIQMLLEVATQMLERMDRIIEQNQWLIEAMIESEPEGDDAPQYDLSGKPIKRS